MELKIVVLLLVLAILIRRCNAKSLESAEKIENDQNQPAGVRLAIREINAISINICLVSDNCNNAAFNNYCCPENICCNVFSYIARSK